MAEDFGTFKGCKSTAELAVFLSTFMYDPPSNPLRDSRPPFTAYLARGHHIALLNVGLGDVEELDRLLYELAGLKFFDASSVPEKGVFLRTVKAAARRVVDTLGPYAAPLRKGTPLFFEELCMFGRTLLHRIIIGQPLTMNDMLSLATMCLTETCNNQARALELSGGIGTGAAASVPTTSTRAQSKTQDAGAGGHLSSSSVYVAALPPPTPTPFNYVTARKEDPHRLGVVGMGVLLVAATRPCKYETVTELLNEYPDFASHDEMERVLLLENANMMYAALSFINPLQNKGVLLSIVPRLTEGSHVKYVTGGGSSKATLDRVAIFEREGNCSVRRRNCGGSTRSKRSRSGHDLSYRRQLVRARLTSQGRVVTNAELMRLARTSLESEGVEAFSDLFDVHGNLKPYVPHSSSAAYSDGFSAGAAAGAGAGASSAAWNENKTVEEGAKGAAASPSIDRTDDSVSTTSSPRFAGAPTAPVATAAAAAAATAPKAGVKVKGKGKGKKGSAAEDGDSDNERSSSSSSIYAENEALEDEDDDDDDEEGGFSVQQQHAHKKHGVSRPPSFFGLDGRDGHPVAPLGAQAAVHLRLRCTTTAGPNGNKVKLDGLWGGLSSMLALAETGDLAAPHAQLAKHPSEVVDSMLEDMMLPMPPPKAKVTMRPDAFASDFVYSTGTSGSGSSSRPRAGWRQGMDEDDAEVSMLLKEAGAKRPAKAQPRAPASKAARATTPLGDANAAELLLNIALGLTG